MRDHAQTMTVQTVRWLHAILLAMSLPTAAGEPLPRGHVVPEVACRAAPTFSYALYLPKGYREDQAAPILFGFSPGGMGREPVDLFVAAADRFGFILVGSNDARNGDTQPILKAQAALWKDVHERFKVDPRRSYSVGFSGGARMALRMAEDHAAAFAGVISFGAFGTGRTPVGMGHLGFVLTCGEEDFNHWELLRGASVLRSQHLKVLEDRYPNGHVWAPQAFCTDALTFFQLLAMERGLVPEDAELRSEFLALRRDAAKAAEVHGELLLARMRWEDHVACFPNSMASREAKQHRDRLSASPGLIVESNVEAAYAKRHLDLLRLQGTSHYAKEVAGLRDQLPKVSTAEACNIRRILCGEGSKFQKVAAEAMRAKDWERARRYLSIQATLQDKEPWPSLYLAAVLCQMGKPEEAVKQVREAYRRGYHQVNTLRDSSRLKGLQGRPDFEQLLSEMVP